MDEVGLGKAIQVARKKAGLTQQDLCNRAALSYSTLAKIERGAIKTPSVFTVARIASVLGTSLDSLLGITSHSGGLPRQKQTSRSGISFLYVDLNGCMVHFFHGAFSRIARDTGVASDAVESAFWHFNDAVCRGDISYDEFCRRFAAQIGVASLDWDRYYLEAVEPVEGMADLLRWAAERYQVGLLTNVMPGQVDALISRGVLPDIPYAAIIDSSQVGAIKPESAIYEIASKRAGVPQSEILFVDDSRANLMAAEQHGWRVLWFNELDPSESVQKIRTLLA